MTAEKKCLWSEDSDGTWNPKCGKDHAFQFNDEGPKENGFRYCPYCGRFLAASPFTESR